MKSSLFVRLGVFIVSILAVLIFSQGLWLLQQLQKEKQDFTLKLESSLQSMVNFHALQGYRTQDKESPNTATLSMGESSEEETDRDTSQELARYNISTQEYTQNFSIYKAIEGTFTDFSLSEGKVQVEVIDSLFRHNFKGLGNIKSYNMQLIKNGVTIDSLLQGVQKDLKLRDPHELLSITVPLGTKGIYAFTAHFELRFLAFLRQMVYTISVSGLAIILVAFFMFWLLWALQRRAAQLHWREQSVRGIVHDLKSPLSYVYTLLDYLSTKEQDTTIQKQLSSAGINVSKLINKMELILTLFSRKNKKIFMESAPYNLHEKCDQLLSELKLTYQEKQTDCTLDIPKNLIINVDPLYFDAALRSLMDNAIKYSETSVKVNVSTIQSQNKLLLYIKDTGKGISQKEQSKIFKEFYRINNKTMGHGIGLAFSKKIIKAHKGSIQLQSEVGKGSTFCIALPAERVL